MPVVRRETEASWLAAASTSATRMPRFASCMRHRGVCLVSCSSHQRAPTSAVPHAPHARCPLGPPAPPVWVGVPPAACEQRHDRPSGIDVDAGGADRKPGSAPIAARISDIYAISHHCTRPCGGTAISVAVGTVLGSLTGASCCGLSPSLFNICGISCHPQLVPPHCNLHPTAAIYRSPHWIDPHFLQNERRAPIVNSSHAARHHASALSVSASSTSHAPREEEARPAGRTQEQEEV